MTTICTTDLAKSVLFWRYKIKSGAVMEELLWKGDERFIGHG